MKAKMTLRLVLSLLLFLFVQSSFADAEFMKRKDVQAFINEMVKKHKFKKPALETLFSQVKIRPQVIQHINKPLEKNPWHTYEMLFVNEWRIQHGVEFWNKYANALRQAEQTFGVPASIIVATIGIETKYGQRTGGYRVMDSLTNLAFNSSRGKYFRSELEEFLLLTREQHLDPMKVMGSYAGAIGQPQFMPSSYRYYAINFSKSGKIDLMNNEVDVIGSIANYYKKHGWKTHEPVAVPAAVVGKRYDYLLSDSNKMNQYMTIGELSRYGIVPKGKTFDDDMKVRVIELQNRFSSEYWLGFHNFYVIKRYNASDLYAMAVFQLGNYILALRERSK